MNRTRGGYAELYHMVSAANYPANFLRQSSTYERSDDPYPPSAPGGVPSG
jgi:hypothetical protein